MQTNTVIKVFSSISIVLLLTACNTFTNQRPTAQVPDETLNPAFSTQINARASSAPSAGQIHDIYGPVDTELLRNGQSLSEPAVDGEETSPDVIFDQALELCNASQEYWQSGDLDNALNSLDEAYSLIFTIETQDSPKLIQQKDDLRFLISKRILEIYASRNIVVNGGHNEIPVIVNDLVKKEIKRFTGYEKKFFIESIQRSGKYRPMILKKLKEAGLPLELSWLPLVESGFKVKALSSARALGLWQFIPSTGYRFGLKRNMFVDERMSPEKATDAAILYLKKMHQIFGDWSTVLAAYNCGEGRVLRLIRSQNINYLDDFWDLYNRLPSETARYVPRFLATVHIINNAEQYGMAHIKPDAPLKYEKVIVSRQVKLSDIAAKINVPLTTLKELNPELRYSILPSDSYTLKIPENKSSEVLASIDDISISRQPQRAVVYHKVRYGETLSTIARKYRTTIYKIARANNISKRRQHYIVTGKVLKIPRQGYVASSEKKPTRSVSDLKTKVHKVKRGDSLWIIARRYGTTVKKIQGLNNLSGTALHIGQFLQLPNRQTPDNQNNKRSGLYYVKKGDSPFTIAMQHNIPLSRLLNLNHLTQGSTIYPGQQLYIE